MGQAMPGLGRNLLSHNLGVSHQWVFCTALCHFSVPRSRTGQMQANVHSIVIVNSRLQ